MRYTYLLINFFTVIVPLLFSFGPRMRFYRQWRFLLPAQLATAAVFLVWDAYFTQIGIWRFNDAYVLGYYWAGLPLEEYLFFLTVPYSCVFIYASLGHYLPRFSSIPQPRALLMGASGLLLAAGLFYHRQTYTCYTTLALAALLPLLAWRLPPLLLQRLLLTLLISILPMLVVNGLLTGLPVLIYNNAENCGWRLLSIPLEDFAYSFLMLGMVIGGMEEGRRRVE